MDEVPQMHGVLGIGASHLGVSVEVASRVVQATHHHQGQAWEYSKAFGLMNLQFNEAGAVKSCGGKASLVIGDNFKRKDT